MIVILRRLSPTHDMILEYCRVAYACDMMCMCVKFRDKIILRGKNVKPRKNTIFRIKGKTVI